LQTTYPQYDIVIIGSGTVGATAALAIAKSTSLRIAVLEAKTPSFEWGAQTNSYDSRVNAIAPSSQRIFENIQVWQSIVSKRISPYYDMHVWEAASKGEITFTAQALREYALGYIIEESVIRTSLLEHFKECSNIDFLYPVQMISLQKKTDHIEIITQDHSIIKTQLVIAADGAESWTRQQLGVELTTWDYQHTAIIATAQTELPHYSIARQRFLPTGPLAFLPLEDPHQSSIVWSVTPEYAATLLSLEETIFANKLSEAIEYKLGQVTQIISRQFFPLKMRHAKKYVGERFALIGDAAHTIHPLAGQGVNLGLLDAASLSEVIIDAHNKKRHFSNIATLRRYELSRKGDTLLMLAAVESLKYVFASEIKPIQYLRHIGLNMTNRLPFLKNFMANYAIGKRESFRYTPTLDIIRESFDYGKKNTII
jgi:2-octaprenylphenol hydroxylase